MTQTGKSRMIAAMKGEVSDRVPVAPDISNMIPAKLTGKPFWDVYLYQDPPLWQAYLQARQRYGFDGWLPLYHNYGVIEAVDEDTMIVERNAERIVTRRYAADTHGQRRWADYVGVYPARETPTMKHVETVGLRIEATPGWYEPVDLRRLPPKKSLVELYHEVSPLMGDDGVVGLSVGIPGLGGPEDIYRWADEPDAMREEAHVKTEKAVQEAERICRLRPDFLFIGYSGILVWNTLQSLRELCLPALAQVTAVARRHGIPSQMHCCGPSRKVVEICAERTDLCSINPLERPPLGDCDMAEIKRLYGQKISLMGNVPTVDLMLFGTPADVERDAKWLIDVCAPGGGFILSTGDQCGRDTPEENLRALIETAENYGRY